MNFSEVFIRRPIATSLLMLAMYAVFWLWRLIGIDPGSKTIGLALTDEALIAACADADLLLSLAELDPAYGGEHLATWATEVVAVVTAGRSTALRIHGVGEMVRLAGVRLGSVIVVDADERDESVGLTSMSL